MTTINIPTTSDMASDALKRIEVYRGQWYSYGRDGRSTMDLKSLSESAEIEPLGRGWRARFIGRNGDYGWGPLGKTAQQSVILLMAEFIEYDKPEWRDDWNDD